MHRIILPLLLLLSISCVHNKTATQSQPTSVHERIEQSVVRLSNQILGTKDEVGVCTAFSIGSHRFLTAAHCVADYVDVDGAAYRILMRLDGHVATPLVIEETLDLAVVISDLDKPALRVRKEPLSRFETVYAMGYGHGFTEPIITAHKALLFHYSLGGGIWPGNVYATPFVGGMSGGPVYDEAGGVVGIVQRASLYIGYGVDLETLHGFLGE